MENELLITEARKHVGAFSLSEPWLTAGAVGKECLRRG